MQKVTQQLGKEQAMTKIMMISILIISLALAGCSGMSPTQQRTLSGGAMGAAGGAAIGAIAGNAGLGAVIGGAAGLTGGFLYDQYRRSEEASFQRGYQQGRSSN
jgi:osmotically inducible lipoprotein OsmB